MRRGAVILAFLGGAWTMLWSFAMLMMSLAWHDYERVFLSLDVAALVSSIAAFTAVGLVDRRRLTSSVLMLVPGLLDFALAIFFARKAGAGASSEFFWPSAIPGIMLVAGAALQAASRSPRR